MKIKVGDETVAVNKNAIGEDFFAVLLENDTLVTIAVNDGEYSVYNALDTNGNKVYDQYRDHKVKIITDEPH